MGDFIELFAATILNRDFYGLAAGWLLFLKFILDFSVRHISGLAAGWLLFFKLNIDLFSSNFHVTGLAAGWLVSTYSSNRANPRSLFRDVALRRHFPGLPAGWLLPCCDEDAQTVPGEVHRFQQFTGLSAGWLLSLCEKGEQFLVVKLETFDYTSHFLNLLTVALTFNTLLGQSANLTTPFICQLFHSLCQSAWAIVAHFLFVPLTSRVGCLLRLFGELFLFPANSWFLFFGLVFPFL